MITYPNLYYLKYFADAVELGSISGAAQKNLVTHPAISRAISTLEKHLGVQLLDHQKKAFKVTEEGYKVAEQARMLLTTAAHFNSRSLAADHSGGTIAIGISRTLSEFYLEKLLKEIGRKFPLAKTQVRFGTTHEITQAVADGSVDLGITIGSQNLPTLKQTILTTGNFLLVESGTGKNVRESWESKSFLLTEPRFETELLKKEYQRLFKTALPVFFEIGSWEVIGQLVRRGMGVGLLPDIATKNWKKGSYRVLRPAWFDCEYEIYLHHPKTPMRNRILRHLLDVTLDKSTFPFL